MSGSGGKRFERGLVVGKFSPLHLGHELLLNRAAAECDELFIISYSLPEFPGCGSEQRAAWLAELFPHARRLVVTPDFLRARLPGVELPANDADELAHRRFCGLLCWEVFGVTVDAVFTSEDYGDGFARELTRFFREHDPAAPEVRHVLVDLARVAIPISGTAVRADIHGQRRHLSPAVYRSFVRRVCLLGGESTGKTTLAMALAAHLGTVFVPEYGRELWVERDGALAYDDMLRIGQRQVAMETDALPQANRFLICDTSPLTTLFYSHAMFGRADEALEILARRAYDLTVVCLADIPFVQDGTRQDAAFRARQHAWYLERLAESCQLWMSVAGSVEERVRTVAETLRQMNASHGPRMGDSGGR